jgi:hypothetical protein
MGEVPAVALDELAAFTARLAHRGTSGETLEGTRGCSVDHRGRADSVGAPSNEIDHDQLVAHADHLDLTV